MCSGFAFLIGLFLLFKGEFRIVNRTIPKSLSRTIALVLMAPPIIAFCAGMVIFSINTAPTVDDLVTVTFIELGSLVIALGLVAYNIYNVPPSSDTRTKYPANPITVSAPPEHFPDIMTVAEAAAYMHVSEAEVLRLIDEGKLGAARMGSTYRIARIAIEDFKERPT